MPSIEDLTVSRFLKKERIKKPFRAVINAIKAENVAAPNAEPDVKFVLYLQGLKEGIPLGARAQRDALKAITGTDDPNLMVGHQVVVYVDPNVTHMGKTVGGIRFRAPKQPPADVGGQGIPAASPALGGAPAAWHPEGGVPGAHSPSPAPPPQGWSNAVAPVEVYTGARQDPPWMEEDFDPRNGYDDGITEEP